MKGVRKISKHSKKYLQCFIFLLLFFLTGCNPLNSFDSNSVEAEEHVAASGNGSGYIIDSYDIKQPDKKAKKVVKTYDTDTTDVTHISIVSALTDATESVLSNIADHVKLRREKREEETQIVTKESIIKTIQCDALQEKSHVHRLICLKAQ